MLSIRTFARSAPRAISRMTLRQPAALARPSTLLKPASAIAVTRTSAFSTTIGRRAAADAENDAELSAKLSSEIQIEEDIKASEQEPSSVKDFLANTVFEIEDTPGNELVKLTRSYNDEKYV
jgi:complement component 1 Q subcomponent-binding protein